MKLLRLFAELTLGRVIILALFLTAGYYYSYFDAGENIETSLATTEGAIREQEARKATISETMKKEQEMLANVMQLSRDLEIVKSKIPNDLREVDMQRIINQAAVSSGITIDKLESVAGATDPNAPPREINISELKPENLIDEVRFNVTIQGNFEAFMLFIDSLAKEDKVIKLRNFTIKSLTENPEEDRIQFSGEVVGFKQANIKIIGSR